MEKKTEKTFEEKLTRLNEIVEKVENTTLSLEDAMKLYEEGNALIKDLQKSLDEAETKIQVIKDKQ
ncbi:MAG: exodeoxyribonuclease VII small subunit [Bacilli bacterium]|jgi:exodeoxyribonuclease VII small subunit|nr:exodeoxyribonuclease VII small subunit [Bacilli bacterium]MBQ4182285.1 exodeoxyribonuclease VII small subunit [Bacilli bacterium]MBR6055946.1 exodeoxyribonuclease VII small subunit [Bacilli bacterium]